MVSALAGADTKKRKSPAKPKTSNKKTKKEDQAPGAGLTQATVEDVSAATASKTDAKLVDPNTGDEVHLPSGAETDKAHDSKPKKHNAPKGKADSTDTGKTSKSKARAGPKGKGKKQSALINPNTGDEVDAAPAEQSKPAAKSSSKRKVKDEADQEQAGPSSAATEQDLPSGEQQYVNINRAPVLTLWVAVVAERQGFSKEAGVTFGRAISSMLAQSKGR